MEYFLITWLGASIAILKEIKKPIHIIGGGFIIAIVVFAGFGLIKNALFKDAQQAMPLPKIEITDKAAKLLEYSWPRVLKACPGLNKYQSELTVLKVDDLLDSQFGLNRIDVEIVVNENAKIPRGYRANGHHCYLMVSADGTDLSISKRACASLCADKNFFDQSNKALMQSGHNYVIKLKN
jgi:hypothetical protein